MGSLHRLCHAIRITPGDLSRILDVPTDVVHTWIKSGVPLEYSVDVGLLERTVDNLRAAGYNDIAEAVRSPRADFDGRSFLDIWLEDGPGSPVLSRVRASARTTQAAPSSVPAHATQAVSRASRSV